MLRAVVAIAIALIWASATPAQQSRWVQRGATGRLIYTPDAQGDRIADFSGAGYRGGGVPLPQVAAVVSVSPVAGDDTASLQAAINQVASLPLGPDGFRGAVQLGAGEYQISGQLRIEDSGIVLRGAGQDGSGSVLRATGSARRSLIEIEGASSGSTFGATRNFIDKVVPVGSRSFRVDSASGFAVGDTVRIERPSTAEWISELGTDMIPPRPDGGTTVQWEPGAFNIRNERVITRIEGDRIFIDSPLTNAFEQRFGGGTLRRLNTAGRIENIGIENLRAESDFAFDTDEDHATNFVSIDRAENVFVRDATSAHFVRSSVLANPGSIRVTVDNVTSVDPVSQIAGGRRFTFDLSGQLGLVTNSEANEGRHDFVNNSSRPAGPNVFHRSVANNALDESGAHQRWASGTLFDNITVEGDQINAYNRGYFGTGHGWAGANQVIWNSDAESFIVQNPPTAQNWLIGSTGQLAESDRFGVQEVGNIDSHGTRVEEIDSLYEAQLTDAADVTEFRSASGVANWNDPNAWRENLTPAAYRISQRDYLIGDIDDFENDGSASIDNAFLDPAWRDAILATSANPITGFDDTSGNQNVAFTIQTEVDAGERVVHGSLALALTQTGGVIDTDFLRLFDTAPEHRFAFSELGWDVGLTAEDPFVGVVDLGGFLDELQSGEINVQLNDDTAVDWAIYTATVATPIATTSGTVVSIGSGGSVLIDTAITGVDRLAVGGATPGELAVDATGSLAIVDEYQQNTNGVLRIELADPDDGERIAVQGDAVLDGMLEITLAEGFAPTIGDTFELIAAEGDVLGVFSETLVSDLPSGLAVRTVYTDAAVLLEVVLAGDYNGDGLVDALDYLAFRDTLGSTTQLAADGSNNQQIDSADFPLFVSSFGNTSANPASAAVIPEPCATVLLLTALTFSSRRNRPESRRP